MRRIGFRLLAASSLLWVLTASAASRPRYGGTLHIALQAAPASLDPANATQSDSTVARNLLPLIYDSLVSLDEHGTPQPALARSWEVSASRQRWRFSLHSGVTFSDTTPLTGEIVAASLRAANPTWRVSSVGDSIAIERDSPSPGLLAELAMPRYFIVKRDADKLTGTGAFVVSQWDPAKKLVLMARDDYWNGRPFLDSVAVTLGKNYRDQMMALDLGQEQWIEIAPEQAHRAAGESRRVRTSAPGDLLALVFDRDPQSPDEAKLRQSLSLSIDRGLINNVLLQGGGETTAALLPNWMTGYEFVFPAAQDLTRAQQLRGEVPQARLWTLSYDTSDFLARVIAERVALNARDAGLRLQLGDLSASDVRLVRTPLVSPDPRVALSGLAATVGLAQPNFTGDSTEELYENEGALLRMRRVIPLLHLRTAFAVSMNVRGWKIDRDGRWNLPDVWLAGKP
jgi:peptide/nickel transport system substrate-binding protein